MVEINAQTFNGVVFPHISIGVLSRTVGQHDCFQLVTIGLNADVLESSYPVVITWVDAQKNRTYFYGYADMQAPTRSAKMSGNEYVVMGPTYVMRSGSARVWQRRLAHEIFTEVMAPYKLAVEYDTYEAPIEFFSQAAGESDWQTMAKLADRIGYSLASQDIVVRFVDPTKEAQRAAARGGSVTIPAPNKTTANAMASFSVSSTTTPTGLGYKDYVMSGVDRLGQRFSYRPSFAPVQRQDIPPEVEAPFPGTVATLQDAIVESDRIHRMSRWTQTAKMEIHGSTDLAPSYSINVNDPGLQYSGFWHVTGSQVVIQADDNISNSEITLCRDTGAVVAAVRQMPLGSRPKPRLVNNQWQADKYWTVALS